MYPGRGSNNEAQQLRAKQIDSLRQYFPTVKEITPGTIYEIPINLPPDRKLITLKINLPIDFPRVPPTLQIYPPVRHRFVDAQMFVTAQAHNNLREWPVHTSLGKTIYEIIQLFMKEPPQLGISTGVPFIPPSNQRLPYPVVNQSAYPNSNIPLSTGLPYPSYPEPPKKESALPQAVIPSSFPELESKTPSELAQLLNNEEEFKKFFESLECVSTVKKVRDDLRNTNEELAKKNLAKEAEIETIRKDLAKKQSVATEKREAIASKSQKQQEVMRQFSTPALIEKLTDASMEAEKSSEDIAELFVSGKLDHKDFVKQFMEERKLYHLRAAKKESLTMLASSK